MGVIIRLLNAEGKKVIDSISGDYEDSFSLETFEDLCQVHFELEPKNTKGFIIARVKTLDPKQPEAEFYSYYSAYQLNKQLFQTQVYLKKKFIHRLHVLNPLTNSDIIGNVDYFLVKPPMVSNAVVVDIDTNVVVPAVQDAPVVIEVAPREPEVRESTNRKSSARRVSLVYTQNSIQFPQIQQNRENVGNVNSITTHKVALEEPENKISIPNLLRRHSVKVSSVKKEPVESPIVNNIGKSSSKRPSGLKITTQMPTGSLSVHASGCVSATVGQITRFTIPVPREELETLVPKTQSGNRRSLSYQNAVSATGQPVSFLEWTKMISEENHKQKKLANGKDEFIDKDFDKVEFKRNSIVTTPTGNPLRNAAKPLAALPRLEEEKETESQILDSPVGEEDPNHFSKNMPGAENSTTNNDTNSAEKVEEESMAEPLVIFDAVLFANDNDYLEQSKIRQVFRANAVSLADAKLFEMKEYTGERSENDFEIVDEPFLCDGCYPTDEALTAMNPFKRFICKYKCVLLALFSFSFILGFIILMLTTGNKSVRTM